jgi:hypothetical protein
MCCDLYYFKNDNGYINNNDEEITATAASESDDG